MTGKLLLAILAAAALGACGRASSPDERAAARRDAIAATDPAVTAALADPIMTDRDLGVADETLRVRHVSGPAVVSTPPRSKANGKIIAALDGLLPDARCETGFSSGDAWRRKIPAAFAPFPGATGIKTEGLDKGACHVRVASFDAAASPWTILGYYRARATAAGYVSERRQRGADHVLTGRRARDGASFYMIVSPRAKASAVALLTSGGA